MSAEYGKLIDALKKCGYPGCGYYCGNGCVMAENGGTCEVTPLLRKAAAVMEELQKRPEIPEAKVWDLSGIRDKTGIAVIGKEKDINRVIHNFNPAFPYQNFENAGSECAYMIDGVQVMLYVVKEEKEDGPLSM